VRRPPRAPFLCRRCEPFFRASKAMKAPKVAWPAGSPMVTFKGDTSTAVQVTAKYSAGCTQRYFSALANFDISLLLHQPGSDLRRGQGFPFRDHVRGYGELHRVAEVVKGDLCPDPFSRRTTLPLPRTTLVPELSISQSALAVRRRLCGAVPRSAMAGSSTYSWSLTLFARSIV
jgi:hypothetical protein